MSVNFVRCDILKVILLIVIFSLVLMLKLGWVQTEVSGICDNVMMLPPVLVAVLVDFLMPVPSFVSVGVCVFWPQILNWLLY